MDLTHTKVSNSHHIMLLLSVQIYIYFYAYSIKNKELFLIRVYQCITHLKHVYKIIIVYTAI